MRPPRNNDEAKRQCERAFSGWLEKVEPQAAQTNTSLRSDKDNPNTDEKAA